MTRQRKTILWAGLCLSLPAAAYASLGFVYFIWLQGLQQPSLVSPALLAFGCLALAVLSAGAFVYCLVTLIKTGRRL